MSSRIASIALCSTLLLTACAGLPPSRPLEDRLRSGIHSMDVVAGFRQTELYAAYVPSTIASSGAAACGAIPGLGVLLAAACGGLMGAADGAVNASRAKDAATNVQPLKEALNGFNFDDVLKANLDSALADVQFARVQPVALTRKVDDKEYEQTFKSSSAGAVMFLNPDYHMSPDFSAVIVSFPVFVLPREATLRNAAGLPVDLSELPEGQSPVSTAHSIYRNSVLYEARLPGATEDINKNVAGWATDNAGQLKTALRHGALEVSRILVAELKRSAVAGDVAPAESVVIGKFNATVVSKSDAGKWVRFADGTLKYLAELSAAPAALASASAATLASTQEAAPVATLAALPATTLTQPPVGAAPDTMPVAMVASAAFAPAPAPTPAVATYVAPAPVFAPPAPQPVVRAMLPAARPGSALLAQPRPGSRAVQTFEAQHSITLIQPMTTASGSWWYVTVNGSRSSGWLNEADVLR